ncbi:hypothetical protein CHU98_g4347 [Xylaria longipes]|nr:hypothetical protein CHU98_g4347 [Xylaria longipes]
MRFTSAITAVFSLDGVLANQETNRGCGAGELNLRLDSPICPSTRVSTESEPYFGHLQRKFVGGSKDLVNLERRLNGGWKLSGNPVQVGDSCNLARRQPTARTGVDRQLSGRAGVGGTLEPRSRYAEYKYHECTASINNHIVSIARFLFIFIRSSQLTTTGTMFYNNPANPTNFGDSDKKQIAVASLHSTISHTGSQNGPISHTLNNTLTLVRLPRSPVGTGDKLTGKLLPLSQSRLCAYNNPRGLRRLIPHVSTAIICPEIAVVVDVMNVLGKPLALANVELATSIVNGVSDALDENVRVTAVPDSVTTVSLQVVSTDEEGVGESVTIVVVPDSVRMVSLHVVSIDNCGVDGIDENVTMVMVPDCVIVLSLHVDSQMKTVLSASEVAPIEVMLFTLGTEEGCVTVKDPDIPADPEGNCDELGAELVGPAGPEELDGGNNPDVDRAEGGTLVPGMPVDGVTAEPDKEISGVPELGLGLMIELVPAPSDEVLSWPLTVTAPVFIEVSVDPENGAPPVVRVARILETELEAPADDMLLETPDDKGTGLVSEPVSEAENVGCGIVRLPLKVMTSEIEVLFDIPDDSEPVLVVGKDCGTEPGPVTVPSLVILAGGREVALVKFVREYGPEVKVWLGMTEAPVVTPELVSKGGPLEVECKLVFADRGPDESEDALPGAESEPCEVRVGLVTGTLPKVTSVLDDGADTKVTVELGIVKGGLAEGEPDGTSEPLVVVARMLPELNPVSDTDDTMPLGAESAVELARVEGGMVERGLVGVSEFPAVFDAVLLKPELVSDGNNTVPFDTRTSVVIVVPMMVVGSSVIVVSVRVVSTAIVIVVPVIVVGVIVNVSIEDETPVLFALAEFAGTPTLLVEVAFVTGYGAELDGCTDMAPELPLALVRLAPEEDSKIGEVPEEIDDVSVTLDVIDPPLGTIVGLMRLDESVAVTGGILERGPVEPVPMLVSRPEVRKGGTVFVPKIDVAVMLDGIVRTLLGWDDGPPDSVRPLVAAVELGNGNRPVEELLMDPGTPVDNGGLATESEPTVDPPGNPDVKLPTLIVAEPEGVVITSVEKLTPRVRLPLALTELRLSEGPGNVVEDTPEPRLLGNSVGPTVATVELVIGNGVVCEPLGVREPDVKNCDEPTKLDVLIEERLPDMAVLDWLLVAVAFIAGVDGLTPDSGVDKADDVKGSMVADSLGSVIPDPVLAVGYDPVPDTISLELLSGKGAVDGVLEKAVPEENAVTLLVVASGGAGSEGALDDAVDARAVEREPLSKDPVMVEGGAVPMILLVSPTPSEVELLRGYGTVCPPAETDCTLGLVAALVPVTKPPVGPTVGTEEFVIGNGVASLPVKELTALLFVGDVMVNDSEVVNVKELGTLNEIFVTLAVGSDEFVIGKGVNSVVPEDVPVRSIVEVISLLVKPDPDVTRVPVGLTKGTEEFVNGNGADSLAVPEVGLPVGIGSAVVIDSEAKTVEPAVLDGLFVGFAVRAVEFVNGKGIMPVLRELVMFAETDVEISMDPVLDVGGPVIFD